MTALERMRAAAETIEDEQGNEFVRIPYKLWIEYLGEAAGEQLNGFQQEQAKNLRVLLEEWKANPDDTPSKWWDEFDAFLKENRSSLMKVGVKPD